MRLAVLADIHGNLPALEAVQSELERIQPDSVVLDGDLINPIPFSNQVIDSVRARDWAVVRGNHEFYLLDYGTERAPAGSEDAERGRCLHWLVKRIGTAQANYLAALPDALTLRYPGTQPICVSHGVPGRNRVGFYQDTEAEKVISAINMIEEATVISAHTHVQVDRVLHTAAGSGPGSAAREAGRGLSNRGAAAGSPQPQKERARSWRLINPGSIGLPLNGDVRAQFATLESVPEAVAPGGWRVTHHQTPYDRRPALEAFRSQGLLQEGGPIAQLFYWELVTAEQEIVSYFRWSWSNGFNPDASGLADSFAAYKAATGREELVRQRDPLKADGRA